MFAKKHEALWPKSYYCKATPYILVEDLMNRLKKHYRDLRSRLLDVKARGLKSFEEKVSEISSYLSPLAPVPVKTKSPRPR